MMDLEDRLRGTFAGMADEVPASRNPRAELERRLADHTPQWRIPALVAAAAVVVAAVAVPVVLFGGSGTAPVGSPPPATTTSSTGFQDRGDGWEPEAQVGEDGSAWSVYRTPDGLGVEVCSHRKSEPPPPSNACMKAQFGEPPVGHVVLSFQMESDEGPLQQKLLFVAARQVADLTVRDAAGERVDLTLIAFSGKLWVGVADFKGPYEGFGYTAKDANGNVLEEALT